MLVTMHVSSGQHRYTNQYDVSGLDQAMPTLLASEGFRQFSTATMPTSAWEPFSPKDVFLFIPMEGLRNAWLAQVGRPGEYFTVVLVKTHEGVDDDVEQIRADERRPR
jgi:hypothetical protein